VVLEAQGSPQVILQALEKVPGQVGVRHLEGTRYEVEAESDIRPEVARAVVQSGANLLGLEVEAQSLDEIYARYFEEVKHAQKE
jgi:ABC-2 type transport system ATP-binding protein